MSWLYTERIDALEAVLFERSLESFERKVSTYGGAYSLE